MRYSAALILCLLGLAPLQAQAQGAPLSAIDWLRPPAVDMPVTRATPQPTAPQPAEPPVASTVGRPQVTVTTLGQPRLDAVGLLPSQVTGLPQRRPERPELTSLASITAHNLPINAGLQTLPPGLIPPLT